MPIVEKILVKALMQLPSSDFSLCLYLVPYLEVKTALPCPILLQPCLRHRGSPAVHCMACGCL